MTFKERTELIANLNLWENKYQVETWMIEEVHIWPILKKEIFLCSYNKGIESSLKMKSPKGSLLKRTFTKVFKKTKAWLILRRFKIDNVNFLFSGAPSHRVLWKNNLFNRYFDPIKDYLLTKGERSYLLEYHNVDLKKVYKSQQVFNFTEVLPVFAQRINFDKCWDTLKESEEFKDFLNEIFDKLSLDEKTFKNNILRNVQATLSWAALYEYFLKKTRAKYTFGLCYYSVAIFGMNLAAKRLRVISIDMQHGGQGDMHFAYHFNKIPVGGYNILPRKFWVWDNLSYKHLDMWTDNENHSIILGGNPWIEFLKQSLSDQNIYKGNKPMILLTLQPLSPIIDNYFLEVISLTCQKYNWWLRLHPRMTKKEVASLDLKIEEYKIREFINVEDASNEPLPLLLNECSLHVSKYSGSIAEAALMQKPSLIIDEIGVNSFKDLIESHVAVACLTKNPEEIKKLIESILNNPEIKMEGHLQKTNGYKSIIDEYIEKIQE